MIERNDLLPVQYARMEQGMVVWTDKPLKGLKFSDRDSAEQLAEECLENVSIREHIFMD